MTLTDLLFRWKRPWFVPLLLVLCFMAEGAMAATCTSRASGNWNSAGTWTCTGGVTTPGAGDSVVILSPHRVDLNGNNRSATNLTINLGGTLDDDGQNLTLSGSATINGTYDGTGNNGRLIMTGNGQTLSGTGTIIDIGRIQIDANITIPAGSNLQLTLDAEIRIGSNSAATLTVDGVIDGTAQNAGNRIIRLDNNNPSGLVVNGTINAPNSFIEVQSGGVVTNNGTVTLSYIDSDNRTDPIWTQGANSSLTVTQTPGGAWRGVLNASASGNTVTYNGTATPITPSANTYYNLAGTGVACPHGFIVLGTSPCVTYPVVTSINRADPDPTSASSVSWTVTFSASVTGVDAADFVLVAAGPVGASITSLIGSGTTWTVTASAGTGTGTLGLNLVDDDSIVDGSARTLGGAGAGNGNFTGQVYTLVLPPSPQVSSINTASANPTAANTVVTWTVIINTSVTGVDLTDFALVPAGGVIGATLTSVVGSGTTYTVTANTGTGTAGTLALRLVDNDTIVNSLGTPLGGVGAGNGNFTGQAYTLIVPVCTAGLLFCDDFERAVVAGGSNTAGAVGTAPGYGAWTVAPLAGACGGVVGNRGCAGIDSDIPPFDNPANPRANPTRSLYTRWSAVTVTSPVINLAGRTGARLSFWMRRGSDCFSEWPSNNMTGCGGAIPPFAPASGEEFQVQYLDNTGTWIVLAQYPMDDTPGEILAPVIGLPDEALHANFQFRFAQPGGSGSGSTTGGAPGVRGYDYWHVDNVVMEEVPAVSYTGPFCDTFEGDLSRWDLAGVGNVRIGSTWFQNGAQGMDLRWNTVRATTKATDLSTNSGNDIISFWVKRGTGVFTTLPNGTGSEYPDVAAKGLVFEYRNNVGTWVQLGSIFVGGGVQGEVFSPTLTPLTNSFPIPADAKHANFKLRVSMQSGSGFFDQDYWHVDDVCVGTTISATDLSMSMTSSGTFSPGQYVTYTMTVVNNGPNPDPGPITIVDTLPVGLAYVSGSAGWVCIPAGQVVTCTQAAGLAVSASTSLVLTATVDPTASGSVTNTATVGGQTNDTSLANNTATKVDSIFVPGYMFTDKPCVLDGTPVGSGAQCSQIAWSPQTAGTPQGNVYISAVNASNVPIQLHATNPTTVNMEFGLSCIDPVANAGVQATFYDAATTTLPLCTANGASPASWSAARALVFPAATPSVGPFSFNYNDVGSVELYMRNSAVTTQMGRSGGFVVRPAGFVLSAIQCTTANAANCGAGALAMVPSGTNPAAADATGATFIRAGHPFSVTVTAVNSLGNATPNYGREVSPESVRLTGSLVGGLGLTNNPAIGGSFGAFAVGVATGTAFTWNEAGIITLLPSVFDTNYLGAGDISGTPSPNVGRFYAAQFVLTGGSLANRTDLVPAGVGTFTYMGEPMGAEFTLTAKAVDGVTTLQNYVGAFSKLNAAATGAALGLGAVDTGAPRTVLALDAATASSAVYPSLGAITYTVPFSVQRGAAPSGPFNAVSVGVIPQDSDGATLATLDLAVNAGGAPDTHGLVGTTIALYGRLQLGNAFGSERLALNVPAVAQSFVSVGAGGYWVTNSLDNATSIANVDLTLAGFTGTLTGPSLNPVNAGAPLTVIAGASPVLLGPPSGGEVGSAVLTAVVPGWLKFPWGGAAAVDPTANVSFGLYGGSNRFIYRREVR